MQNTESNYLIKLKIAIDKAKGFYKEDNNLIQDFVFGWDEAIADLSYVSECGELDSKQHIDCWLGNSLSIIEHGSSGDNGYISCISYIHNEMNKGSPQ